MTDIYPAGEKPIPGVIGSHNHRAREERKQRERSSMRRRSTPWSTAWRKKLHAGDLVITMGAGDITRAGDKLLERLGRVAEKKDAR